jgi:putative membrane protein
MDPIVNVQYLVNAVVFSLLGLAVFGLGFFAFDKITPYQLWKEINEKQNMALAIVVGSTAIAIGLIISSAIHG